MEERLAKKGKNFSKKKIVSLVGFGFGQIRKICNFKAVVSAIIAALKKLSQLSEKAVTTVTR